MINCGEMIVGHTCLCSQSFCNTRRADPKQSRDSLEHLSPLQANRDVYVVDLDKPFHDLIKAAYKGTMPRVPPRVTTRTGIFGAEFLASQDGEQLGVQASVRIRLPTISRVDALDAGETNEEGLNGIEPEGLNGIEPRLQSILSGAIPRADAAHADAARQTSDAQSLFLGFEDFARRVSNDGSDGGVGSSRRSVEMVSGSSFGGPNAPEVHSIASDASAQSLSHAGEQLQDRESLAIATASSVQTPSEDLESVRPSLSQGASACRQRDAALAAVARAMDAPDSVSTAAEQRTDLSKPGLVHPSIGGILRSSSTEREQSRGAAETDAVEADGTSAVARPRPQEIETTRANLDGGVRFYLRDSPRGEMERGDEKDRGRKSDESFGSSSKRPGLVRRSLDLVRTRRPEDPSTRAGSVCVCVGAHVCVHVERKLTGVYVRMRANGHKRTHLSNVLRVRGLHRTSCAGRERAGEDCSSPNARGPTPRAPPCGPSDRHEERGEGMRVFVSRACRVGELSGSVAPVGAAGG
jgi:hypothetical protein